ncbi:cation diffusion facilitator family transporter [Streptococcus sp. 1001283B150225_161107_H12]|uniref:cation diffusion facilitator family transporter n=1 Tax=Streptococcus sp. 1001283B150225_161107_H12 TaxID=2787122 RepID=UPI001899D352|nr:cation diffusion facilitator family transporter [Streptococcus sp. 1001283B150225_161107_H12]
MSSKFAVWLAFVLNFSFAIIEFIFGGLFGSSAILADAVHDLGDALAIGISAFLESISNREEDIHYTLGYKRFSLLGAILTAVILITGSSLVILENISKLIEPQPVDHEGMLWLGVIAIAINLTASLIVRKGQTKNESILSLHFLEDTLGWLAVIVVAIILRYTDWYFLDPLLSLLISAFILSKAIPRFWSTLKIFLDAVPEGVDIQKIKSDLEQLDHVTSINQLNLWTMDGLEKNAIVHVCLEHVNHMEVCKEAIRTLLKDCGFQNVTIEVDEDLATHRAHKRKIEELEADQGHGHDHHH